MAITLPWRNPAATVIPTATAARLAMSIGLLTLGACNVAESPVNGDRAGDASGFELPAVDEVVGNEPYATADWGASSSGVWSEDDGADMPFSPALDPDAVYGNSPIAPYDAEMAAPPPGGPGMAIPGSGHQAPPRGGNMAGDGPGAGIASDRMPGAASSAATNGGRSSAGPTDGAFTEVTWDELYELDLETGEPSPLLAGLDGQPVRIPGFMVPLDDYASEVREFLLVPYAGACIHVPPPPANQIVHVTMVDGFAAEVVWWDPIWIYGALEIDTIEHTYGQASFRLEGLRTELYTIGGS